MVAEMVERVPGFKVMCVDSFGMKVISSCLKMSDITDYGVATVENVELQREPLPDMECIYFVEPCMVWHYRELSSPLFRRVFSGRVAQNSWIKIRDDFQDRGQPQYRKAHLFFTSKVVLICFVAASSI